MTERLRWFWFKLLPSRALGFYVGRLFLSRTAIILFVLITLLQSLDLLNRSDDIMSATGDTGALFHYIRLRLPELVSQFLPFAVLLAALFSYYTLAQNSEVTIMRGSGLAPGQVAAPMILAALLISLLHILFHDKVTVDASRALFIWQANDYTSVPSGNEFQAVDLWLMDHGQVIEARSASRVGDQVVLDGVTLYERNSDGLLARSTAAEFALYSGGHWTLYNVRGFDLGQYQMSMVDSKLWSTELTIDQIFATTDRPDHMRLASLSDAIDLVRKSERNGVSSRLSGLPGLETSYHHRLSIALSSILMPLIAIFVGFGTPRGGARIGRVVLGLGIGFGYFVVDSYVTAMGSLGIMPPLLSAYGVLAFFLFGSLSFMARLD